MKVCIAALALTGMSYAQAPQAPNPTQRSVQTDASQSVPIYRITVTARTMKAINYHHRSGSTMIDFRGTDLMPEARGEAKVESKQGVIKIDAVMSKMQPATRYGPEYLTYVMWAITPEGRAENIGEVLLNGGNRSKLNATSELQTFGLIITAEPYFAVTQPSDVVVMENFVRSDTTGTIEQVDAKYELLQRGQYTLNVNPRDLHAMVLDPKTPLELYEARNAVQIARWTGAEKYAPESFHKAVVGLQNAEDYLIGKGGKKPIGTVGREAVQMAEDARIITIKKMQEEQLSNERAASADREAQSRAAENRAREQADAEARLRAQAEADQKLQAQRAAQAQAAQASAEQATAAAKAEAERVTLAARGEVERAAKEKGELEAARLAAQAEAARVTLAAKGEGERAAREKAELEAARALAQSESEKARQAAGEADRLRQAAEAEKTELRAQLLRQFNLILETRDSARGLIVNMSDVLFDTAKYSLRAGAREKLAKVSGIILGHPGLKLEVEGHTDSVGGDEYNQKLSEQRAGAVQSYLVQQGISAASVTAKGFGKTQPVVSNDTAAGRQQNRRVELVVSGEIIGMQVGTGGGNVR